MSAIIDYRGKSPRKTTSGVPLITAKVVKSGRIETPDEFIDPEEYDEWMTRGLPQVGDVVITTEAPLGEVAQLSDSRIALAQRLILLRGKTGLLDNTYLKYLLMSDEMQGQLASRASGTTVVGIKQSELRKLALSLPAIDEQEAIAAVLGALDDKIEQNRRTGLALEALARTMFKAWFVDFEPVKAKAAGQAGFPGMPHAAFAALTDRLADSPLGKVPEGWEVGKLGDYSEINKQRVHSGQIDGEIEYIDIASVTVGRLDSVQRMPFADAPSRARRRVRHGDTIWSRVRPNRRSYLFVHSPPENRIASTGFAVLSPATFGASYLHELTTRQEFVDYLVANVSVRATRLDSCRPA